MITDNTGNFERLVSGSVDLDEAENDEESEEDSEDSGKPKTAAEVYA